MWGISLRVLTMPYFLTSSSPIQGLQISPMNRWLPDPSRHVSQTFTSCKRKAQGLWNASHIHSNTVAACILTRSVVYKQLSLDLNGGFSALVLPKNSYCGLGTDLKLSRPARRETTTLCPGSVSFFFFLFSFSWTQIWWQPILNGLINSLFSVTPEELVLGDPLFFLLPPSSHLPPTTDHLLPTTYYRPPTTYNPLPTTHYLPPTTYHLLPTLSYDLLPQTTH